MRSWSLGMVLVVAAAGGLPAGCSQSKPPVDPKTSKLRSLAAKVSSASMLDRTERQALAGLLARLTREGKLTEDGRMIKDKPMTTEEKRAILSHRAVCSAVEISLTELKRAPASRPAP